MDILEINDLTFKAILGIHPFERQMPQKLVASLSLGVTCKEIAQTDNINNTIDYDILCQKVTQFACDNQCHLLET
ncbi:MAG TPA: dihydroneopterin aldolase, partial [Gammaproteobacteria bacterium]|nr:dihydroneopterin aldolase [Gammaproteobacteria bacterium]